MSQIFTFYAVILFLIGIVTWIIYKTIPKLLWCVPAISLFVLGSLFLRDIFMLTSEPTFAGKFEFYFHNDWSMGFYLFYLPIVVISVLITINAYLLKYLKSKSIYNTKNTK